jgi:hypothetical protein
LDVMMYVVELMYDLLNTGVWSKGPRFVLFTC